ncbi:PhoX family protein [Nonomuraea sp. NBC_01738]|uniref:alkaline phosphatase PhoX n=1 Tax=Nonomuraea sp. NBC_01738 TaxID=2976003 RepID=UPI002E1511F7|nr:PhoX family protein [Nonomuraea sp. NBC_01738]
MLRRTLLRTGAVAAAGSLWQGAARASSGPGPYGPLGPPGPDGLALPPGFTGRVVARSGRRVAGLSWHAAPDGGACFPDGDGWIYVSNSEIPLFGGASALRFAADGTIRDAYRVLSGTDLNCAGGATPWGTWLSCEEAPRGRVFECDPYGGRAARPRLAMGRFKHEAAACDPVREVVYLTEDQPDGCFYRFRPRYWGDLTEGALEVLTTSGAWKPVPHPAAPLNATRHQVPDARHFDGGEGCHYLGDVCYFTTKGDNRVWAYHADTGRLDVLYDAAAPLSGVDNITAAASGELFVAEDGGDMEINVITPGRTAEPFLRLEGHGGSEITGPAFSPDGGRLYFSSQRGRTGGAGGLDGHTFEVTGPFHR